MILSRVLHDSTPRFVDPSVGPSVLPLVRRSVRWSVCPSVGPSVRHTLLLLGFRGLWPRCSCPNDLVTSITAPAQPHATGVAVYPALLFLERQSWCWGHQDSRNGKTAFLSVKFDVIPRRICFNFNHAMFQTGFLIFLKAQRCFPLFKDNKHVIMISKKGHFSTWFSSLMDDIIT